MAKDKQVTVAPEKDTAITAVEPKNYAMAGVWADRQSFEMAQRMATALANSTLVPLEYQSHPVRNGSIEDNRNAVSNCLIAIDMAANLRVSPLIVMQNVDVIHGRPGLRGKFLLALLNSCGQFDRIKFEWKGQKGDRDWGCRAYSRDTKSGDVLYGAWVDMVMVNAEGWSKKGGSKWGTMPEQMFMYRAGAFFERVHAPNLSMGMYTAEELIDVIDDRPKRTSGADLSKRIEAEMEVVDPPTVTEFEGAVQLDESGESGSQTTVVVASKAEPIPVADSKNTVYTEVEGESDELVLE
jgi:hypothetical protein